MAWNEPGGNNQGDKDPWGNKNDQGPPDLDEAFKKLQNNLSQMFGGKGGGSGGSGGGSSLKMNSGMIGGLIILALSRLGIERRVYARREGKGCCAQIG